MVDCLGTPSSTLFLMPSWLREVVGTMLDMGIVMSNIMATAMAEMVDMILMICLLGSECLVALSLFSVLKSSSGS